MIFLVQKKNAVVNAAELEEQLIDMFQVADKSGDGVLDHQELMELLQAAQLQIHGDDVHLILAAADFNEDGRIEYKEFVPIATELVQVYQAREKARENQSQDDIEREEKAMQIAEAYLKSGAEAEALEATITQMMPLLEAADYSVPKIRISNRLPQVLRSDFTQILMLPSLKLQKYEVNMLLVMVKVEGDYVLYDNVPELFQQVRLLSIRDYVRQQMNPQGTGTSKLLLGMMKDEDSTDPAHAGQITGYLTPAGLRLVLERLRSPRLTVLQVLATLAEAQIDSNGMVEYEDYAPVAAEAIDRMFSPDVLEQKQKLMMRAEVAPAQMMVSHSSSHLLLLSPFLRLLAKQCLSVVLLLGQGGNDREALEEQLLQLFLKHDEDQNGVLDPTEMRSCLKTLNLDLTDGDVEALMLEADQNGDGSVDYDVSEEGGAISLCLASPALSCRCLSSLQEFIAIAYNVLVYIAREKTLFALMQDTD
jgi:Ca2+-binding EF-hand superfamily protein